MKVKVRKMTDAIKASIRAMTQEEIHESIWMCKKKLYIIFKYYGGFAIQQFKGGDEECETCLDISDLKDHLIFYRFFPVCHFKDLDMESILVERGF